jgi:putative ABC transport system ATP-binding protein
MSAVRVRNLEKVFGEGPLAFRALRGVTLEVPEREVLMLAGPSGSGKTTLLSIVGCVLGATAGEVEVLGHDLMRTKASQLPELRLRSIGFVFQGHNLLASLTARQNVSLPLSLQGVGAREADRRAVAMLERVGLGDKVDSLPSQLSGGQRQRVAISRALVGDPPLILADEPTAALDARSGLLVTELLRELARERHRTVIIVTHDSRIFHLADRIVHMEDGVIVPDASKHQGTIA